MNRKPWFALVLLLGLAPVAFAHKPSDSYLSLTPRDSGWTVRWDIALRDLEYAIGLDGNGDGTITWGEVRTRESVVAAYALAHLTLRAGDANCAARSGSLQVVIRLAASRRAQRWCLRRARFRSELSDDRRAGARLSPLFRSRPFAPGPAAGRRADRN